MFAMSFAYHLRRALRAWFCTKTGRFLFLLLATFGIVVVLSDRSLPRTAEDLRERERRQIEARAKLEAQAKTNPAIRRFLDESDRLAAQRDWETTGGTPQ